VFLNSVFFISIVYIQWLPIGIINDSNNIYNDVCCYCAKI